MSSNYPSNFISDIIDEINCGKVTLERFEFQNYEDWHHKALKSSGVDSPTLGINEDFHLDSLEEYD